MRESASKLDPTVARLGGLALICLLVLGCSSDVAPAASGMKSAGEGAFSPLEFPAFCARSGDDSVRDVLCGSEPASIGGIADVVRLLKLDPAPPPLRTTSSERYPAFDAFGLVYVAVLGHSTSLAGQHVSPINPRAIVFGYDTALAYTRGVQRVELAGRARDHDGFNFYLIEFEQACNDEKAGCAPGDLYTPRIERDWLRVRVRDDEELANTAFDCRQCHQRARDSGMLLMRELENPWTHFFFFADNLSGVNGSELVQDYLAAKGDETYGGIATLQMTRTTPRILEAVAGAQPLLFDAPRIHAERFPDAAAEAEPLASPTWDDAYDAFKRGEQLALPYVETRATDPDKQAKLTEAYARFRAGKIAAEELPDLGDIFPDDPLVRARIGLQTEPDSSPEQALITACGSCHNDVLDQSLSRARFNIDVSRLDRAALDLAIDRIELPRTSSRAMPPPDARQLDPDTRARLIDYLSQAAPIAKDPTLTRAAELGMAGR